MGRMHITHRGQVAMPTRPSFLEAACVYRGPRLRRTLPGSRGGKRGIPSSSRDCVPARLFARHAGSGDSPGRCGACLAATPACGPSGKRDGNKKPVSEHGAVARSHGHNGCISGSSSGLDVAVGATMPMACEVPDWRPRLQGLVRAMAGWRLADWRCRSWSRPSI